MAADPNKPFLDGGDAELYRELLLQAGQQGDELSLDQEKRACKSVVLIPGFCLKTKDDKDVKVFINVCKGENLPAPKDLSDEEILKLIDSEDPSGFRIPMSIGEPHAELDKSGGGCTAYDVVINPRFYERVQTSQILLGFFLTVVLEGLEYKYNISLNRDWKMLKNRKFVGSLPKQNVRTKSKPWIMDMSESNSPNTEKLISELPSSESSRSPALPRAPKPVYTIVQEPCEGYPEFLVAEIHLPKVKSAVSLSIDIGEDRIVLATRANVYHLDIYLPYNLVQEDCGAQFNRKTKIVTITMPVAPIQS